MIKILGDLFCELLWVTARGVRRRAPFAEQREPTLTLPVVRSVRVELGNGEGLEMQCVGKTLDALEQIGLVARRE